MGAAVAAAAAAADVQLTTRYYAVEVAVVQIPMHCGSNRQTYSDDADAADDDAAAADPPTLGGCRPSTSETH